MTRAHTVADLSFRDGWVLCSCGETVRPSTTEAFSLHRRGKGARWVSVSSTIGHREGNARAWYEARPVA